MSEPTDPQLNSDNFCYRHPDRMSFILCQRCTRTVCVDCQTEAPVGVICPECLRGGGAAGGAGSVRDFKLIPGGKSARRGRTASGSWLRSRRGNETWRNLTGSGSPATYILIGITAIAGLIQWLTGLNGTSVVTAMGSYSPQFTDLQHIYPDGRTVFEPWRMLTSAFLHMGALHFAFNMLSLWIFGRALEPVIGTLRFVVLYLVSALGGSLAVAMVAPNAWVVGASGAIFGLFAAWFVVLRTSGQDVTSILVLIGLNVAVSFMNPGISWEAHLGGLAIGLLCGWLTMFDLRRAKQPARLGLWLQLVVAVVCVAAPPIMGTLLP